MMYIKCYHRSVQNPLIKNFKFRHFLHVDIHMIRTQIQLHSEQVKWLKKIALEKGISMSQAIRDSVDFYRSYTKRTLELRSKKNKALKAVGTFSTNDEK